MGSVEFWGVTRNGKCGILCELLGMGNVEFWMSYWEWSERNKDLTGNGNGKHGILGEFRGMGSVEFRMSYWEWETWKSG